MRTLSVLALLLTACTSVPASRGPSSAELPWGVNLEEVPSPEAISRWADPRYEHAEAPKPAELTPIRVDCSDPLLYPTHPQQNSKTYHVYRVATYDAFKVPAETALCKIPSRGSRKFCQLADVFEHAVISDIYMDSCGHLYRGLWRVNFLKQDDNMGMLFSKGRTLYPKPNSEFEKDMEVGQTYSLQAKDFLILAAPFPGDESKAAQLRQEAGKTHHYDPATHLFQKKP